VVTTLTATATRGALALALALLALGCSADAPAGGGTPMPSGGAGGATPGPGAGAGGGGGRGGAGNGGTGGGGGAAGGTSGAGGAAGGAGAGGMPMGGADPAGDGGGADDSAGPGADASPEAAPASGLPGPAGAACAPGASYAEPLPPSPAVALVSGNVQVAEGPLWIAAQRALYLTDIEGAGRIYRFTPADQMLAVWVDRVGVNGLSMDPQGHIVAASPDMKQLTRFDINTKARTAIAGSDMFEGKRFNSVNDVLVRADGHMYFSDPGFMTNATPQPTAYYHLAPGGAAATRLGTGPNPNSLGIPADGKYLYVTSSPSNAADGRVWRHPLHADGSAGPRIELINQRSESLAIDCAGNLYLSFAGKVLVYTADGRKLGELGNITAGITNLTFGGEDGKTLYITARGGLYASKLLVPGLPN
jgi:gluconolactonase